MNPNFSTPGISGAAKFAATSGAIYDPASGVQPSRCSKSAFGEVKGLSQCRQVTKKSEAHMLADGMVGDGDRRSERPLNPGCGGPQGLRMGRAAGCTYRRSMGSMGNPPPGRRRYNKRRTAVPPVRTVAL